MIIIYGFILYVLYIYRKYHVILKTLKYDQLFFTIQD
jgi:hypothetical protein